jgi:uncharacterized membrane-anchored protein YhcB (DUF1043 family)
MMIELVIGMAVGAVVMKLQTKPFPKPLTPMQVDMLWAAHSNGKSFEHTVRLIENEHGIK